MLFTLPQALPTRIAAALCCAIALSIALPAAAADTRLQQVEHLMRSGDAAGALAAADAVLANEPGDATLRFLRTRLLSDLGRATEAELALRRMTLDFPELPEPHNNLAVMLAAAGRLDEARDHLAEAVRRAPTYRTAQANLGDVLLRLAERAYRAAVNGAEPGLAPPAATDTAAKLRAVQSLLGTTL